jgi:hypothetical protein
MRQIAERRADFAKEVAYGRDLSEERAALTRSLVAIAAGAPDGIRFDTLRIARSNAGWTASIAGQATGASTARAVRNLDEFYQAVRRNPGVVSATLDQFDYPTPKAEDSTHKVEEPLVLQFRVSFDLARTEDGGTLEQRNGERERADARGRTAGPPAGNGGTPANTRVRR